jgi:hypothetical protein
VEISRPKYWSGNIQTKILACKYSDQNFGVKIFRSKKIGMKISRPKYWSGNLQTKILA